MKRLLPLIFFLVLLKASLFSQIAIQPVGILPGSIVDFSEGASQSVTSYCLDIFSKVPDDGTIKFFSGRIKLTFKDGQVRTLNIQDAIDEKIVQLINSRYSSMNITSLDKNLASLEFINGGIGVSELSQRELLDSEDLFYLLDKLERIRQQKMLSRSTLQVEYVWNTTNVPLVKKLGDRSISYSRISYNDDKYSRVHYFRLENGGSIRVIKDYDGRLVMTDTGFGAKDYLRIKNYLMATYQTDKIQMKIILSHLDKDHINGLETFIKSFDVNEIVIPGANPKAVNSLKKLMSMKSKLEGANYSLSELSGDNFLHFKKAGTDSYSLSPESNIEGTNLVRTRIYFGESTMSLFRHTDPLTPNEHSIVTHINFNNVSHLDLGDANTKVIRQLLKLDRHQLESTVMQWPHHYWIPNRSEQEILKEFLDKVGPQKIFVSHGRNEGSRYALEEFFDRYQKETGYKLEIVFLKDYDVNMKSENLRKKTKKSDDIEIITFYYSE